MNSKKNQPNLTADKKIGLLVVQTSIEKKQGNSPKKARQRHKKVSQDVMSSEELLLLNKTVATELQLLNKTLATELLLLKQTVVMEHPNRNLAMEEAVEDLDFLTLVEYLERRLIF